MGAYHVYAGEIFSDLDCHVNAQTVGLVASRQVGWIVGHAVVPANGVEPALEVVELDRSP
jgi:hypothetical protein